MKKKPVGQYVLYTTSLVKKEKEEDEGKCRRGIGKEREELYEMLVYEHLQYVIVKIYKKVITGLAFVERY